MMVGLAADHGEQTTVMIPEGNRTATFLGVKRGARTPDWANQVRYEHETALHLRLPRTPSVLVSDRWTSRDYIGATAPPAVGRLMLRIFTHLCCDMSVFKCKSEAGRAHQMTALSPNITLKCAGLDAFKTIFLS